MAEALGTFAIVFAGCGAVLSDAASRGALTHVGVAATFGLTVAAMIFALGPVSAAHFNPAVTIGFAAAKRFPWRFVPVYVGAQLAGAVAASALHGVLYGPTAAAARYGATVPAPSVSTAAAFGFEVVLTFLLMLVIMATATDRRITGAVPGIAIGGTVGLCALFGGPMTGASINPARSLAPALFAGCPALATVWLYCLACPAGAVLGAWTFEAMRDGRDHAQGAPADLEAAMQMEPGLSRQHPGATGR